MTATYDQPGSSPSLFDDHAQLRRVLGEVRETLAQREVSRASIVELLAGLTETVLDHFQHEEEGGYFAEALELAPRMAGRVADLFSEHPRLASQLVALEVQAACGDDAAPSWHSLSDLFDDFLRQFCQHERAEDSLLLQVYTEDIGAED